MNEPGFVRRRDSFEENESASKMSRTDIGHIDWLEADKWFAEEQGDEGGEGDHTGIDQGGTGRTNAKRKNKSSAPESQTSSHPKVL